MSPRYLIVVADEAAGRHELLGRLSARTGLGLVLSHPRLAVLANPDCPCVTIGAGCVLGSLFHRHGPAQPVLRLSEQDQANIARTDGLALPGFFWGAYVAAIETKGSVRVLRDPSGNFPCYYSTSGGLALASDADLLTASGICGISIDFDEIGRLLYRALVPAPATALCGIRELLAGFALRATAAHSQEPCWSPWDHVSGWNGDRENAADQLSRIAAHSVHATASTRSRLLLSVSGGFDSSVVAACLAKSGADTLCLTMFTEDPGGDERRFARALCDHLGLPLIERPYRLEDIDIGEPLAANLPRPRDRIQAIAYERVHEAVAAEVGADAFVTGNGGDNVFGFSQSAAPIADRYLNEGLTQGVLVTLLDVCRQTGCSMFEAVRRAWPLARRFERYRVRPNPLFLDPDFVAALDVADVRHPWLEAPADALPGKAAHIAAILRAQPNLEPSHGACYPVLNPLMSQPIIEACLAIPTWEWRSGGRDRSLARRAFAGDLPPLVADRRVKGTPSGFAARLLDHFRVQIRERLLGGRLAANRILDTAAVEKILAGERPIPDLERVRILELVSVEAWIDHWSTRGQALRRCEADIKEAVPAPPSSSADPIP